MELGRPVANSGDTPSLSARDVREFPALGAEAAAVLGRRWRDHHDIAAAQQLAAGHRGLVVKIAGLYRGYGLPLEELAGEGHLGLMRAVCRFDPDRGVAFATYAAWWVRAAIQAYVLSSWSRATIGTAEAQQTLLFRLRRTHGRLQALEDGPKQRHKVGGNRAGRRDPARRVATPPPGRVAARRPSAAAEDRAGLF